MNRLAQAIYAYDVNGNVSELLTIDSWLLTPVVAQYVYAPFGKTGVACHLPRPLASRGDVVTVPLTGNSSVSGRNSLHFSTIYSVPESRPYAYDTRDYGYLSFNCVRFLSRDPIGELGGINLYGFVENNPMIRFDKYGLNWDECKNSAKITIFITGSERNRATIEGLIEVTLDETKCKCICEWPRFKQKARDSKVRLNQWDDNNEGNYLFNSGWADDNGGQEYYPLGTKFLQYNADLTDAPGEEWPWQRYLGFLVELDSSAVCTKGTSAGQTIGSKKWGLEVWVTYQLWPPQTFLKKRYWPKP